MPQPLTIREGRLAVSKEADFRRELDALYARRTDWLRHSIFRGRPGPPTKFSRKTVNRAIKKLQAIASDALASSLARTEFFDRVEERYRWYNRKGKGHGRTAKVKNFKAWYRRKVRHRRCIYAFWAMDRCLYVGKSKGGAGRVASHFTAFWFGQATRVDIYAVTGDRDLPILECLGIHRFQPSYNKSRAEAKKWTAKCPLCKLHRGIEAELRSIYRLHGA